MQRDRLKSGSVLRAGESFETPAEPTAACPHTHVYVHCIAQNNSKEMIYIYIYI